MVSPVLESNLCAASAQAGGIQLGNAAMCQGRTLNNPTALNLKCFGAEIRSALRFEYGLTQYSYWSQHAPSVPYTSKTKKGTRVRGKTAKRPVRKGPYIPKWTVQIDSLLDAVHKSQASTPSYKKEIPHVPRVKPVRHVLGPFKGPCGIYYVPATPVSALVVLAEGFSVQPLLGFSVGLGYQQPVKRDWLDTYCWCLKAGLKPAFYWGLTQKQRNALQHALNGNILPGMFNFLFSLVSLLKDWRAASTLYYGASFMLFGFSSWGMAMNVVNIVTTIFASYVNYGLQSRIYVDFAGVVTFIKFLGLGHFLPEDITGYYKPSFVLHCIFILLYPARFILCCRKYLRPFAESLSLRWQMRIMDGLIWLSHWMTIMLLYWILYLPSVIIFTLKPMYFIAFMFGYFDALLYSVLLVVLEVAYFIFVSYLVLYCLMAIRVLDQRFDNTGRTDKNLLAAITLLEVYVSVLYIYLGPTYLCEKTLGPLFSILTRSVERVNSKLWYRILEKVSKPIIFLSELLNPSRWVYKMYVHYNRIRVAHFTQKAMWCSWTTSFTNMCIEFAMDRVMGVSNLEWWIQKYLLAIIAGVYHLFFNHTFHKTVLVRAGIDGYFTTNNFFWFRVILGILFGLFNAFTGFITTFLLTLMVLLTILFVFMQFEIAAVLFLRDGSKPLYELFFDLIVLLYLALKDIIFPVIPNASKHTKALKQIKYIYRILGRKFSRKLFELYVIAQHWTGENLNIPYRHNGILHHFSIRDNLPRDDDMLHSLMSAIFLYTNRNRQDAYILLVGLFIIFSLLVLPIRYAYKTLLGVLNIIYRFVIGFVAAFLIPNVLIGSFIGFVFVKYEILKVYLLDMRNRLKPDSDEIINTVYLILKTIGIHIWFSIPYDERFPEAGVDRKISKIYKRQWVSVTRHSVKRLINFMDDMRLPEFIQAQYEAPTLHSIRSSYVVLKDMGFPVDQGFIDSIRAPNDSDYLSEWGSFKTWLMGHTDFKTGYIQKRYYYPEELRSLGFPEIPGNVNTSTYTGIGPEIQATSRYWSKIHEVNLPYSDWEDITEGAWEGVKYQYANSKLSSPSLIFKYWVKKFNMGFGFRFQKVSGKWKQMRRQDAIRMMGGKTPFLAAWRRLFKIAPTLSSVAPVFTKIETLKLSKYLTRSVRTVVGSAFVHHVMTTIFNYKPNHNYAIWDTPMKVGMPQNGKAFGKLWTTMEKHDAIWAGDMTAFDSTLPPMIVRMVADLRKKGFETHKDYHRICTLIDLSYENLLTQPLGFKAFGDIGSKQKGFSTGHSSTSPDNSLALFVVYLYAWKRVTGLRAREFLNFNTLANFGDDHILGYDKVFGWSPEKAVSAMAELGIIMRDEGCGQNSLPPYYDPVQKRVLEDVDLPISFLSKKPLRIRGKVREELNRYDIKLEGKYATCHDRTRLIRKLKGQVPVSYTKHQRWIRYNSYLTLLAHHEDIYNQVRGIMGNLEFQGKRDPKEKALFAKLPKTLSYGEVLRKFYEGSDIPIPSDYKEEWDEEPFYVYEAPSALDYLIRWASDVPTLLSPRYANMRWADWIQVKACKYLSWPLKFVTLTNKFENDPVLSRELFSRTTYNFLRSPTIMGSLDDGTLSSLFVRHYIFMLYTIFFKRVRRSVSLLDTVRLLDHAFVNMQFMIFGKVTEILIELDLHIDEIIIIILLSYIHVPDIPYLHILSNINIESPSMIMGSIISYVIAYFAPSGSIDFQPFDNLLRNMVPGELYTVSAPTGTGKSTSMVVRAANVSQRKIVVLLPRSILVKTIVPYMQSVYPNAHISGSTTGMTLDKNFKIAYCTTQSFLMSTVLRNPENIIILDEAHIQEPAHLVALRYLSQNPLRAILMTATPRDEWGIKEINKLKVPAVNSFNVIDNIEKPELLLNYAQYISLVAQSINTMTTLDRAIVFVPTLKMGKTLEDKLIRRVCHVNSNSDKLDYNASVFICTNTADAGLTIPDVNYVYSSDTTIQISSSNTKVREDVKMVYHRLDKQTIIQRRGRTGRTNNGYFILYKLRYAFKPGDILEEKLPFTPQDYSLAIPESVIQMFPYLPASVQLALREEYKEFSENKDLPSFKTSGASTEQIMFGGVEALEAMGLTELIGRLDLSAVGTEAQDNEPKDKPHLLGDDWDDSTPVGLVRITNWKTKEDLDPSPKIKKFHRYLYFKDVLLFSENVSKKLAKVFYRVPIEMIYSIEDFLRKYTSRHDTTITQLVADVEHEDYDVKLLFDAYDDFINEEVTDSEDDSEEDSEEVGSGEENSDDAEDSAPSDHEGEQDESVEHDSEQDSEEEQASGDATESENGTEENDSDSSDVDDDSGSEPDYENMVDELIPVEEEVSGTESIQEEEPEIWLHDERTKSPSETKEDSDDSSLVDDDDNSAPDQDEEVEFVDSVEEQPISELELLQDFPFTLSELLVLDQQEVETFESYGEGPIYNQMVFANRMNYFAFTLNFPHNIALLFSEAAQTISTNDFRKFHLHYKRILVDRFANDLMKFYELYDNIDVINELFDEIWHDDESSNESDD